MKYMTLHCYPEDGKIIKEFSKKHKLTILEILKKLSIILINRESEFLHGDVNSNFEDLLNRYSEKIRKGMVKENNRILGVYINTNKMVKSMNNDLHYLLNWDEEDRYKLHPFFVEYELQKELIMNYLYLKYGIENDEKLIDEMSKTLTKGQVEDYKKSIFRTNSRKVSTLKY